jgi:hypothetical protein
MRPPSASIRDNDTLHQVAFDLAVMERSSEAATAGSAWLSSSALLNSTHTMSIAG